MGRTDIGLSFLRAAASGSAPASQLRARSEPAMIAAVGLDLERRGRAHALLSERLADETVPLQARIDLSVLALELTDDSRSAGELEFALFVRGLGQEPANEVWGRSDRLRDFCERINPRMATRILSEAIKSSSLPASLRLRWLLEAFLEVAPRLEPGERMPICYLAADALLARLKLELNADYGDRGTCAYLLTKVANLSGTEGLSHYCEQAASFLLETMRVETDPGNQSELASYVLETAARTNPKLASLLCSKAASYLAPCIGRGLSEIDNSPSSCFARLTRQMDTSEASALRKEVARKIAATLDREKDSKTRSRLALELVNVVYGGERRETAELLLGILARETDVDVVDRLQEGLKHVTRLMGTSDAAFFFAAVGRRSLSDCCVGSTADRTSGSSRTAWLRLRSPCRRVSRRDSAIPPPSS